MKHAATPAARPASNSGGSSRLAGQLPYGLVLGGIVAGLLIIRGGAHAVRGGTLVLAGALLAGSLIRLALPEGRAGLLKSRRRLVDCAVLAVLGAGLLIAGLIVRIPV
jgi:hypothetical protein